MISSAISADLGRQELIQGSSEALATVTGIVDGTGSIGAAVGQYLVSLIQDNLGWMWVFYFFILMTSCTILFISPLIVREICYLMQRRQAHILSEWVLPEEKKRREEQWKTRQDYYFFWFTLLGVVLRAPTKPQIVKPLSTMSATWDADQWWRLGCFSALHELLWMIFFVAS